MSVFCAQNIRIMWLFCVGQSTPRLEWCLFVFKN